MRQLDVPPSEELRVWRARLRALAPDGTRPRLESRDDGWSPRWEETREAWTRSRPARDEERYKDVLDEAISRLDQRDATAS